MPYLIGSSGTAQLTVVAPQPGTHILVVSAGEGGTTDPPPGTYTYPEGSTVTVKAIPAGGYSFDYWLLDSSRRTVNPVTIVMDRDYTLTAYFKPAKPALPSWLPLAVFAVLAAAGIAFILRE